MNEIEKHCNACAFSFYKTDKNTYIPSGVKMQHCSNPVYNSPEYTHEMLMEDWYLGYCRLWAPHLEKGQLP